MISAKSFTSTKALAERLSKRGFALESADDTALSALSTATVVVVDDNDDSQLNVATTVSITSSSSGPLPSPHNVEYEAVIDKGIEATRRQLTIARNKVIPFQRALVERTMEDIENYSSPTLKEYTVVPVEVPALFRNNNFIALVEAHAKSAIVEIPRIIKLGDIPAEELVEKMKTGFKAIDEQAQEWLQLKGLEWVGKIWMDYFNNGVDSNQAAFGEKITDLDEAVAVYLLATNLFENPVEESSMPLSKYTGLMSDIRNVTGAYIYNQLQQLENQIKSGQLVLKVESNKVVYVNSEVYSTWTAEGGDIDVLLGMALLGDPSRFVVMINEKATKFKDAWARFYNQQKAAEVTNKYNILRTRLLANFSKLLEEEMDDMKDDALLDAASVQRSYNEFREALKKVSNLEVSELYPTVLRLICDTYFKDTDAYYFISRIQLHCKEQPNLDPREAAAIATIEYVTDWVVKQCRVVPKA